VNLPFLTVPSIELLALPPAVGLAELVGLLPGELRRTLYPNAENAGKMPVVISLTDVTQCDPVLERLRLAFLARSRVLAQTQYKKFDTVHGSVTSYLRENARLFEAVREQRPALACINDDMFGSDRAIDWARKQLSAFYRSFLPNPSPFEHEGKNCHSVWEDRMKAEGPQHLYNPISSRFMRW